MNVRTSKLPRTIIVGAGMGGLSAALRLAAAGQDVTVVERHTLPGGKLRELQVGGVGIDSGPTVFTMRWVFESLFEEAGLSLADYVSFAPVETLARHAWPDDSRLDLFADIDRSAAAIESFAGVAEARAYRKFAADSEQIFATLDPAFMRVDKPGPVALTRSLGVAGIPRLFATRPFTSLWKELGRRFSDPRLRQLFGRYATYCGSSPFAAPATLMLIAHAERAGVWAVDGGMQRLAEGVGRAAADRGADLRFNCGVARILTSGGRVSGVELDDGTVLDAGAVIYNGDCLALANGLLGEGVRSSVPRRAGQARSLSAITWSVAARVRGFPLQHHNVFFGADYRDEFAAIFDRAEICRDPTIYLCAQDRSADRDADGVERLFMLINAPPGPIADDVVARHGDAVMSRLERHGLHIEDAPEPPIVNTPIQFAERFPGSGGAIYGWPTHGWSGSFARPGARSRIGGLYLAGGTVHPGPGVPMTALSGQIAADCLRHDQEV